MLMRFDPFRELDRLTNAAGSRQWPSMLAMDAYRSGDRFVVSFDLPGARPDAIELSVEKNVLTVKAERASSRAGDGEVVVAERPQGQFTRQLFLGESLDADHMQASYEDGVLTLSIPVAEKAKPRRVEIRTAANGSKAVDTGATEVPAAAIDNGAAPAPAASSAG
ncbi:MAG TPA: Hsp20/alpha crystallin family protein [Acidimicrobiales bacterium]|nr:Hsp20/alpha crystallin family protein [Acidimicrobiales bacterium]